MDIIKRNLYYETDETTFTNPSIVYNLTFRIHEVHLHVIATSVISERIDLYGLKLTQAVKDLFHSLR